MSLYKHQWRGTATTTTGAAAQGIFSVPLESAAASTSNGILLVATIISVCQTVGVAIMKRVTATLTILDDGSITAVEGPTMTGDTGDGTTFSLDVSSPNTATLTVSPADSDDRDYRILVEAWIGLNFAEPAP